MLNMKHLMTVGSLSLIFASAGFAQNRDYQSMYSTPYETSHKLQTTSLNQARLIMPARTHREVEVSRALHAQPVWPWMAKVVLGGTGSYAASTTEALSSGTVITPNFGGNLIQHTWIDPLQKLDGNNGLDSDHSLVRAQRRHLQLTGVTTTQIADIKNASLAAQPRGAIANHALIIIPPQHMSNTTGRAQAHEVNFARPQQTAGPSRLIMPKASPETDTPSKPHIPSVPRQTPSPDKSVASAE